MAGIATTERTRSSDDTTSVGVSQMFSVIADGDNRTYLALSAQDWHEYAAGMTATDVVIGYQASSGQYDCSSYGWIGQTAYSSSAGASDVTNLPLFGTNGPRQTTSHAANGYPMTRVDPAGHRGGTTAGMPPDLAATGHRGSHRLDFRAGRRQCHLAPDCRTIGCCPMGSASTPPPTQSSA